VAQEPPQEGLVGATPGYGVAQHLSWVGERTCDRVGRREGERKKMRVSAQDIREKMPSL
jgi:hypothetical protein